MLKPIQIILMFLKNGIHLQINDKLPHSAAVSTCSFLPVCNYFYLNMCFLYFLQ